MPGFSCYRQEERSQVFVIEECHRHTYSHANAYAVRSPMKVVCDCPLPFGDQEPNRENGEIRSTESVPRWKRLSWPEIIIGIVALFGGSLHLYALENLAAFRCATAPK